MKLKVLFIINPKSGVSKKESLPEIIDNCIDKKLFNYQIVNTEYAGHATKLAQQAVKDNFTIVVAVGGDGTVNEVGKALINTNTAMGIIPAGSGNGLARHLDIPVNVKRSLQILNQACIHDLDYGMINNMPFFCTCGMGFDAFISMKFAEAGKRGVITYVQKVLEEGLKYKPETYHIEDNEGVHNYKAFLISVANASQYGNNAYIAPQASMSDGLLDIIIMEPFNILDAPQVAIEMFNRKKEGVIHFDGDPTMAGTDIDIKIIPRGIKVVVNPTDHKYKRKPNMIQTSFSLLFSNIDLIRSNLNRQSRRVQALNKTILRKLNI